MAPTNGLRPVHPGEVLREDDSANHLIELALAGRAAGIVTHNVRDLDRGELIFDHLRSLTPAQCLEEWP